MTPADRFVPLLDGVRRTGQGKWIARCPAHDDRSPSLSVRETDDGTLLLRCWAGCSAHEIVGAVGLDLADLFPPRERTPGAGRKPERRAWIAADLLQLAAFEAGVAVIVVGDVLAGRPVAEADVHRMIEAGARLADMVEAVR